jgi:hypothetical protein
LTQRAIAAPPGKVHQADGGSKSGGSSRRDQAAKRGHAKVDCGGPPSGNYM